MTTIVRNCRAASSLASSTGYSKLAPALSRSFTRYKKYSVEGCNEESSPGLHHLSSCPIRPGTVIDECYTAKVKLGYGRTATTWLCKDRKGIFKVLKIGTASATQREKAAVERLDVARSGWTHSSKYCVRHPDRVFTVSLQGKTYRGFEFEPLGPSLLEFTSFPTNQPLSSEKVRWIAVYILHALDFLHSNGIIHADIKPDNIQITLPEEEKPFLDAFCAKEEKSRSSCHVIEAHAKTSVPREMKQDVLGFPILCDLGSSIFIDTGYNGKVQAHPYRAPEVILGAQWDEKIDIWSFGVLIWELLFTERLFGNADEHGSVRAMIRYLGPPPKELLSRCQGAEKFFDGNGTWHHGSIDSVRLEDRLEGDESLTNNILDFIRCALCWDPKDRCSAKRLLDHPWLG